MAWTLTDDIDAYAAASHPERYTIAMTVLAGLVKNGPRAYGTDDPVLAWWSSDGAVRAAVLHTPPHPLHVTHLPAESVGRLVTALGPTRVSAIATVTGAEPDAVAFARATGRAFGVHMRQRLYRLDELTLPDPMPAGAARVAAPSDSRLAHVFDEAFGAETGMVSGSATLIESRLRASGVGGGTVRGGARCRQDR